jgi:sugar (pentulose or hexulose) kinase
MSFFLGIDLGTSYFKAGIFDEQGKLKGLGRCAVVKETGDGNCYELPVSVFWQTLRRCIDEAIQKSGISEKQLKALSYSSQANSFILLDRSMKPLSPIVLWPDQRIEEMPDSLQTFIEKPDFLQKTGLGIQPGVQSLMAKLYWYRTIHPQIWKQVRSVMTISDYFTFSLTNEYVGDYSTASMTGLLDVSGRQWWDNALEVVNLDKNHLSTPVSTGTFIGKITKKGTVLTGLASGTLFFSGALDHHMVAIGAGFQGYDYISESTGTVLASVGIRPTYQVREGVNIAPGLKDNEYFEMSYEENGAVVLEWYQKNYAPDLSIVQLLALAEKIEIGSGGLVALPNANKYNDLKGFMNQAGYHLPAHFARSILESICLSLYGLLKKLDMTDRVKAIIPSGGGAQSKFWIQIKADILNKTFLQPDCNELACKGAAMLGFTGSMHVPDMDEAMKKWVRFEQEINPKPANVEKYKNWIDDVRK